MEMNITITEKELAKAVDTACERICNYWFSGDTEAFEDWAGDVACDFFFEIITAFKTVCGLNINFER